jgi:hypothetical protein
MMSAEKNRLGASSSKAVRGRIEAHIRWLEKELSRTDRDLDEAIENFQNSCFRFEARTSIFNSEIGAGIPFGPGGHAGRAASDTLARFTSSLAWSSWEIGNPTQLFARGLRVAENFFKSLVRKPIKP